MVILNGLIVVDWNNREFITRIVKESICGTDALRKLGLKVSGSNPTTLRKYIELYNIDISHFNSNHSSLRTYKPIALSRILDGKHPNYSSYDLKKRLVKDGILKDACVECGIGNIWNSKPISLQLDHINGVNNDHRLCNIQVLCPNCHSQTDTFGKKAISKDRTATIAKNQKIIDENNALNDKRDKKLEYLKNLVLKSKINFSKYGWVAPVAKLLQCEHQHVNRWMKKNLPDFYETCYRRKSRLVDKITIDTVDK